MRKVKGFKVSVSASTPATTNEQAPQNKVKSLLASSYVTLQSSKGVHLSDVPLLALYHLFGGKIDVYHNGVDDSMDAYVYINTPVFEGENFEIDTTLATGVSYCNFIYSFGKASGLRLQNEHTTKINRIIQGVYYYDAGTISAISMNVDGEQVVNTNENMFVLETGRVAIPFLSDTPSKVNLQFTTSSADASVDMCYILKS